jgi:hypothetical protein
VAIQHDASMDKIWGCEETCMFCREPCKNTDKSHVSDNIDHHCIQHRPNGIGGFYKVSDKSLCVEFSAKVKLLKWKYLPGMC